MIPKIVHQTARSKDLSFEERMLQRRIFRMMPDWELKLWDDADNELLIKEYFPEHLDAFNNISRGVAKADVARLVYMYAYGGVYMDTDYKLLKPFDSVLLSQHCILPISRGSGADQPGFRLGNAVFASVAGHRFWSDFVRFIFGSGQLSALKESTIEKITGPEGLTDFYIRNKYLYQDISLPQRNIFHPLITMGGFSFDDRHNSYGVHLCWGSWRTVSMMKNLRTIAIRRTTCF